MILGGLAALGLAGAVGFLYKSKARSGKDGGRLELSAAHCQALMKIVPPHLMPPCTAEPW